MSMGRTDLLNIKTILGAFIILVGLITLLNNIGLDIGIDFWDFWPVIIIIIGLSRLLQPREYRNTFAGLVILAVGVLFLLITLDFIDFGFGLLWPIILIIVGVVIIHQAFRPGGKRGSIDSDIVNLTAIMGGGEYKYSSQALIGGSSCTIMGGGTINLSEAEMQGESIIIDVFALMGGVDIIVPRHWQVAIKGVPLLGGMSDKTIGAIKRETSDKKPDSQTRQLIIKGLVIMGGVEVKN